MVGLSRKRAVVHQGWSTMGAWLLVHRPQSWSAVDHVYSLPFPLGSWWIESMVHRPFSFPLLSFVPTVVLLSVASSRARVLQWLGMDANGLYSFRGPRLVQR